MAIDQDDKHIDIIDFRARTDRVVYILENNGKGYFVINNDTEMREYSKMASGETIRGITVGRLLDEEWKDDMHKGKVAFEGFHYEPIQYPSMPKKQQSPKFNEIKLVYGTIIANNDDSYGISDIRAIGLKLNRRVAIDSFDKPILESLEHFLVPENIANEIREIISEMKTPSLRL